MPNAIEYALFSTNFYDNSRLVREEQNTLLILDGWNALAIQPAEVLAAGSTATGFRTRTYRRESEIVVSFEGTIDEDALDRGAGIAPQATI